MATKRKGTSQTAVPLPKAKGKAPAPAPSGPKSKPDREAATPPAAPTIGGKPVPFTPDDLMRFDFDATTARLREGLARAQASRDADTIEGAEGAMFAHVDKMLGTNSGNLTPERRARLLSLFGKPFGN